MSDSGDSDQGEQGGQTQGQQAGGQQHPRDQTVDGGQQPPQGQSGTPGQPQAVRRESIGSLLTKPVTKGTTKRVTGLYASLGIGGFLTVLLMAIIGTTSPLMTQQQANAISQSAQAKSTAQQQFVNSIIGVVIALLPILAIALAVGVGYYLASSLDADDRTTYVAAAVSLLVATLVFVVLTTFLLSTQQSPPGGGPSQQVQFMPLLKIGLFAGIGAAVTGVLGVASGRKL